MKQFQIIVIIQDVSIKATSDGTEAGTIFEGPEDLVNQARNVASLGWGVPLGDGDRDPIVSAGFDSPLAVTAAIYSIAPQYARVYRAPQEVMDAVENQGRDRHRFFVGG